MPLGAQGEFALVREQMERALQTPGQPVRRGTIAHDHDVYMTLTDSAARLRDEAGIRTYAPLLDELAKRDGHRVFQAIAQRAWGVAHRLAGEYTEAAACFEGALHLFEDHAAPAGAPAHRWQIARTQAEMAELALARSDSQAAREHFTSALAAFDFLRAAPEAHNTRAALSGLAQP